MGSVWHKVFRALFSAVPLLIIFIVGTDAMAQFYQKSYALVIGIDKYPSSRWENLKYARNDAEAVASFLRNQGFEVITLYDKEATKTAILSEMQDYLALRVKKEDRILVFFAGHGHTEPLGGKDWGYIVPYHKGEKTSTSYISMEELQTLSQKMGNAKHQLFVMVSCYGGLLGTRGGGVNPNIPNYLQDVTNRKARQIITAGGRNQQVVDGGPGGHSFFTARFLEALREGLADTDGDGYITFAELTGYIVPRASNAYQTPARGILPDDQMGEFVFRSPRGTTREVIGSSDQTTDSQLRGQSTVKSPAEDAPLESAADDFDRGVAYLEKGLYDRAISNYTKALEINPRDAEAYYNRSVAYYFKKEYDKAWDDLYKAQGLGYEVNPEFLKALREASGRDK